jgi:hypothetical protein
LFGLIVAQVTLVKLVPGRNVFGMAASAVMAGLLPQSNDIKQANYWHTLYLRVGKVIT